MRETRGQWAQRWARLLGRLYLCVCLGLPLLIHADQTPVPTVESQVSLLSRAYLADPGSTFQWPEVQQQPFTPYQGVLARGYQPDTVYWLRLTIPARPAFDPPLVLRIRPTWHDVIELFDPADPRDLPRRNGDLTPWGEGELQSLTPDFLITSHTDSRDVYLRIQSVHTYMVDVDLMTLDTAQEQDKRNDGAYLFYLVFLILIWLTAVVGWLLRPDHLTGIFVLSQLTSIGYNLFLYGMGRALFSPWMTPTQIDWFTSFAVILATPAGLLFHWALLRETGLRKAYQSVLLLPILMQVVGLMLFLSGDRTLSNQLNSTAILLFAILLPICAWFGITASESHTDPGKRPPLSLAIIRLFSLLFFGIALFGAAPLLGVMSANRYQVYAFLPHGFLTTIVMGLLLHYRSRLLTQHYLTNLANQEQRLQLEQQRLEEQTHFMAMLNHELKTPLSVLKMILSKSPQNALAMGAIDDITQLVDRCLLTDRIESKSQNINRSVFCAADVVRKTIERSRAPERFHLHHMADEVLLHSDQTLFVTMVNNLIDNALKYARPGSPISVALEVRSQLNAGRQLCLEVQNHAGRAGVPDPHKLFQKYYRAEAAHSVSGTGLGLYLVRQLAQMLGGQVSCQVQERVITFKLCLPC